LAMLIKHAPIPTQVHSGSYNDRELWS